MMGNQTARLKGVQGAHWERLFSGRFDDAYFESVRTVGSVHPASAWSRPGISAATTSCWQN